MPAVQLDLTKFQSTLQSDPERAGKVLEKAVVDGLERLSSSFIDSKEAERYEQTVRRDLPGIAARLAQKLPHKIFPKHRASDIHTILLAPEKDGQLTLSAFNNHKVLIGAVELSPLNIKFEYQAFFEEALNNRFFDVRRQSDNPHNALIFEKMLQGSDENGIKESLELIRRHLTSDTCKGNPKSDDQKRMDGILVWGLDPKNRIQAAQMLRTFSKQPNAQPVLGDTRNASWLAVEARALLWQAGEEMKQGEQGDKAAIDQAVQALQREASKWARSLWQQNMSEEQRHACVVKLLANVLAISHHPVAGVSSTEETIRPFTLQGQESGRPCYLGDPIPITL